MAQLFAAIEMEITEQKLHHPATTQRVLSALKDRYIRQRDQEANTDQKDLIDFLRSLHEDTLLGGGLLADYITHAHPDWRLTDDDKAVLISIDECNKLVFRLSDLEPEVEAQLFLIIPEVAAQLLLDPSLPTALPAYSILEILDLIVSATTGWSDDLGRSGESLMSKVKEVVATIRRGDANYEELQSDLEGFLNKEQKRIEKLEERLVATETGMLRAQLSKVQAAQMINDKVLGKRLTQTLVDFLRGPWYDSVQLLLLNKGVDGDDWSRAEKLTETIVWTYQPIEEEDEGLRQQETQRLYRIIESLPNELRSMLIALEHTSDAAEAAIESIEEEHVQIMSGQQLDAPMETMTIEIDDEVLSQTASVSRILLRRVDKLKPGQWFTFEEDNVCIRIKLVLVLKDARQLLFTNRNGMKALRKGSGEIAYFLSSGIIKQLSHEDVFSSAYANLYNGIVSSHRERQKRAADEQLAADESAAEGEAAKKRAVSEARALAAAKEEDERARLEEQKETLLSRARGVADREENAGRVRDLTTTVQGLNIGAWLKLPGADGDLTECKLAVRLTTPDKMIFVSRTGVKIGDYTSEQLLSLIVAGDAEIQEEGVEFEDTLAQVVTKLRVDRNKSYDDLTGS